MPNTRARKISHTQFTRHRIPVPLGAGAIQPAERGEATGPWRLVAYNPWVMPPATEFQDYFCGEGADDPNGAGHLPVGGDGRFTGGPYQGLQACAARVTEGGWDHSRNDTEIGKPRWTAREMAKLLKDFGAARNVPMFNLEIYQDGTMSPATIAMFKEARQLMRGRP